MLLVVVIIAIIVTIATPQFRKSLATVQLANTTQDITQLMRLLRSKACTEKINYQLKFDTKAKRYSAEEIKEAKTVQYGSSNLIPEGINVVATTNPIVFYSDGSIDEVKIYLFKGKGEYLKDFQKAIDKEFELGQIQTVAHTKYVYTITTQPSIGRIKVIPPEEQ